MRAAVVEHRGPALDLREHQEVLRHAAAGVARPGVALLAGEHGAERLGNFLWVLGVGKQPSVHAVLDLRTEARRRGAQHGKGFPHRLRRCQGEAFAQRVLHDESRAALEDVHHERVLLARVHRERQNGDVLLHLRFEGEPLLAQRFEGRLPFRIVLHGGGVGADQHEAHQVQPAAVPLGVLLRQRQLVAFQVSEALQKRREPFQAVPARNLGDDGIKQESKVARLGRGRERAVRLEPQRGVREVRRQGRVRGRHERGVLQNAGELVRGQLPVLVAQRVNAGGMICAFASRKAGT